MNWIETFNRVSEAWLDAMSMVVVQSFLVFAIAMTLAWLLRSFSAALRFWIWQIAALKLLLIPFSAIVVLPFWSPKGTPAPLTTPATVNLLPFSALEAEQPPIIGAVPRPSLVVRERRETLTMNVWLFVGWALICGVQSMRLIRRKRGLVALLKTCVTASDAQQLRVQRLSARLALRRSVRLVRGDVQVPLVTGVMAPTIILPLELKLEQKSFDQVVLHELAHVKRHDLLWIWLPELLRLLLFLHPLAYWIRQQAKLSSEMACDELVLSVDSSRRDYAKTLLALATS